MYREKKKVRKKERKKGVHQSYYGALLADSVSHVKQLFELVSSSSESKDILCTTDLPLLLLLLLLSTPAFVWTRFELGMTFSNDPLFSLLLLLVVVVVISALLLFAMGTLSLLLPLLLLLASTQSPWYRRRLWPGLLMPTEELLISPPRTRPEKSSFLRVLDGSSSVPRKNLSKLSSSCEVESNSL